MPQEKTYIAIDLKSFYASVECVERQLDPLTTNLVVADASRTEKTICLAVSPSLKRYGIPGRARLFEVVQRVQEVNAARLRASPGHSVSGSSFEAEALDRDVSLALDYIVAPPQMAKYMQYSTRIYQIYCNYVAPEDIHVYSIDEVFMDATDYLRTTGLSARDFAMRMILDVLQQTGITATAGIGPNLYLCKVAMDIEAKHIPPDENGVRIAELSARSYRERLWEHQPITDFWRVGHGIAKKLAQNGMHTMGDVALRSTYDEECLFRLFGIQAEFLIDHAWGIEPCTIAAIKAYKPETNSISSGQVLPCPYPFDKGKLVVREMADLLSLDLVSKRLVAESVALAVGYDIVNLRNAEQRKVLSEQIDRDHYGREVPKSVHGSLRLPRPTASTRRITEAVMELYDRLVDKSLSVRRMYVTANNVMPEDSAGTQDAEQLDLFTDYAAQEKEAQELAREKKQQKAILDIQKKYGKNSLLKGMNLSEGATARERNGMVGGHKA